MPTDTFRCSTCEQDEKHCQCDRYCSICYGEENVRLCQDGCYYCRNCREACDYAAQN